MTLDFLQESWAVRRNIFLAQGLDALVAEADTLCADEQKLIHAPATFRREWEALQRIHPTVTIWLG